MKHYEDCWACRTKHGEEKRRCGNCNGKGTVPVPPPIGPALQYRRPLDKVEIEFMEKDPKAYPPVPRYYPFMPVSVDRVSDAKRVYVRISGYVVKPARRCWKLEGTKAVSYWEPVLEWVEHVKGPSDEPGEWRWPK